MMCHIFLAVARTSTNISVQTTTVVSAHKFVMSRGRKLVTAATVELTVSGHCI